MNKIHTISLAAGILGLISVPVDMWAQTAAKDTTLNRQINLEREYTPTIQDASKVNTLPALHQPVKKMHDIKFENAAPSIRFDSYPIGDTGSGDIKTDVNYSKHRGYFLFGVGFYTNLEGALGYRIVDAENDQLDIFASHSFTDARIKYLQKKSTNDKIKAKDMENMVKLKYKHDFETLSWRLSGSYFNDQYNYYGNPDIIVSTSSIPFPIENLEKKQSTGILELETGIQSKKESDRLVYSGNLRYNRYTSKYGPDMDYDGANANLVDVFADVAYPIADFASLENLTFGVKGGVFHQSGYDTKFVSLHGDPFHSLTAVNANPYINMDGDNFLISLGVNLGQAIDYNDKTHIFPTAKVRWNFEEKKSMFYLTVDGGINNNSLVDIYRENKYATPEKRVEISQTAYDAQLGIKSGIVKGLEFDIFGGYKYTKNEHLYTQVETTSWANVSDAIYANLGTGHFGGSLKTRLIPRTDLSLKLVGYFYSLKDYVGVSPIPTQKKAWGLPTMTFDFNADFSIIDNLTATANYTFEGGRNTYANGVAVKMDAINELNLKANYQFHDWLSVYAKANNILNQKYERYYGYTLQGINILGGVSLKF